MVPLKLTFSPLSRRQIEADFSGGHITSDAGLLLLREVDRQHRLTQRPAGTARPFWRCWCDRHQVDYIVGMARNQRLEAPAAPAMDKVRDYYETYGHKLAATFRFGYEARSWRKARLVVARLEYGPQGPNPRFVISSRYDDGFKLYYE
jgi:hypothetical protein